MTDIPPTSPPSGWLGDGYPPAVQTEVTYQVHTVGKAEVHVVTVPPGDARTLGVALPAALVLLPEQAAAVGAIAAINAGFFDPQNGLTASFVTLAGALVGDPRLEFRGGSSSGLYFDGSTAYGRRDSEGQWVMRPVKSILWIR